MTALSRAVVIDTNIVLDFFVFRDIASLQTLDMIKRGYVVWLSTKEMRDELVRVLGYKQILPRLALYKLEPEDVLAQFDRYAQVVDAPSRAIAICKDADDQGFIDLAAAHQAYLLSKDGAVLCMKKRLAALGVAVAQNLETVRDVEANSRKANK